MAYNLEVTMARLEQRLNDHERADEKLKQVVTWGAGISISALLVVLGTMWTNIGALNGSQQVILSTLTEMHGQLAEIRQDVKQHLWEDK